MPGSGISNGESCATYGTNPRLFVQFTCVQSEEEQASKFNSLITMEALAILVSLLFMIQVKRLYQGGKLQQLQWDLDTVTAGDYAVEWKIKPGNYEKWDQARESSQDSRPEGYAFKSAVKEEVEKILNQKLREARAEHASHSQGTTCQWCDDKEEAGKFKYHDLLTKDIEIADICLSYFNGDLIKLLKERGYYICHLQYDKIKEVDAKIHALFANKEAREKIMQPSAAFLIFENEDGRQLALDVSKAESEAGKKSKKGEPANPRTVMFPGTINQNLRLLAASEPTDIIWENRAFTDKQH